MQRDATSARERKAVGHIIHVSNLFFLIRGRNDFDTLTADIYKVANRLAQGQTLTIEIINGRNTNFALYADDENVMESTDRALLQMIVDYSKNNELCLSLENIK
jgi:hypothetical protein